METISLATTNPAYDDEFGSLSPFCGGQTLLEDGSLLIVGGTDRVRQCTKNNCEAGLAAKGHGQTLAARLDTSSDPPVWASIDYSNQLPRDHWYGSAITLDDGAGFVAGHTGDPQGYGIYRETIPYDPVMGIGTISGDVNFTPTFSGSSHDCGNTPNLEIGDYPRLHLLRTGDIMEATGFFRDVTSGALLPRTRFMDRLTPYVCQVDDWIEGIDVPATLRFGGNSVHLITIDDGGNPGDTIEVVYAIGGSDNGTESACDATFGITGSVQRMVDPEPSKSWETVAGLSHPRMNHNSVLLLDGSILVLGGEENVGGACSPVLMVERYRPEEIFDTTSPGWNQMVNQSIGRAYHSTGVLLADGRVLVAGGVSPAGGGPATSRHTVEIYSPPYAFSPRPEIDEATMPTGVQAYGGSFFINVKLAGSSSGFDVKRAALVRASAATHAWDSNQRYVEVEVTDLGGPWDDRALQIHIPADASAGGAGEFMLPPGDYLLTIIDQSNKPSPGRWVRIG